MFGYKSDYKWGYKPVIGCFLIVAKLKVLADKIKRILNGRIYRNIAFKTQYNLLYRDVANKTLPQRYSNLAFFL